MTDEELKKQRHYLVVKSNEFVRESRFSLSIVEQRIVLYMISKIKPGDTELTEYEFNIKDFCEVCGIDYRSHFTHIKESLKSLRDKSVWVARQEGKQVVEDAISWISRLTVYPNRGIAKIKLDDRMVPFLLQQRNGGFTRYELIAILALKSKFSVRLYELFKSYEYMTTFYISMEKLRKMLMIENEYGKFYDFRRYVIDQGIDEIRKYTDLDITYDIKREGKKVVGFTFTITNVSDDFNDFTYQYAAAELYLKGVIPSWHKQKQELKAYTQQELSDDMMEQLEILEDEE